jgi:hypothetical protein
VTSDTGKYGGGDPGGSGTTPNQFSVQVLFEEDPSLTVYKEKTWQWSELVAMSSTQSSYTFIQSHDPDTGRIHYYQSNARGVPFVSFTDALAVSPDDILMFRIFPVGSHAGQYAGGMTVSYDYLFGHSRYFFSMIARDGSILGGAQQVYPMLATSYSWYSLYSDSSDFSTGFVPGDFSALNPCSRLMFGSTSSGDVNASRSIHSVERIVIYLKGAPPVHFGSDDSDGSDHGDGGGGGGNGDGDGTGFGPGSGSGSGGGNGDGSGGGDGDGTLIAGTLGSGSRSSGGGGGGGGFDGADAAASGQTEGGWHVYQMMNKLATELPVIMATNPYAQLLIPLAAVVLVGGAATMFTRYRLQRRSPVLRKA